MAYTAKEMSVLAYANGFTLWHYRSVDPVDALRTKGYFDPAADLLRIGDVVIATAESGAGLFLVNASSGTEATIFPIVAASDGRVR